MPIKQLTSALLALAATANATSNSDLPNGTDGQQTVYTWLDDNYADAILNLDTTDDVYGLYKKRSTYYDALADEISDMIVYDIPERLLDEWLKDHTYEDIITDKWKIDARQAIRESFNQFDLDTYFLENAQTQVRHVTDHFKWILAEKARHDQQNQV